MSDSYPFGNLSEHLKKGLESAIQSYQNFQSQGIPSDAKGFTAHHNACKSALMHIALLIKLVGQSGHSEDNKTDWIKLAQENLGDEHSDDLFSD